MDDKTLQESRERMLIKANSYAKLFTYEKFTVDSLGLKIDTGKMIAVNETGVWYALEYMIKNNWYPWNYDTTKKINTVRFGEFGGIILSERCIYKLIYKK